MWPFRKKHDFHGITTNKKGDLVFNLTEEEQQEVKNIFKQFEGTLIHRDFSEDIRNGTTSLALSNYAGLQVAASKAEISKEERRNLLLKAISAITKAYSIYQLPIYIFDLACFLEMDGRIDEAMKIFRDFVKKQSEFKFVQIDELFLEHRDIDEAIKYANTKVIQLAKNR